MAASFKKWVSRLSKSIMKSHSLTVPRYNTPVRLRPWFLIFTCLIMVLLAFLGFTNFSRALPLNDKLLHFLCFALATGVFYFILDVEEDARRIWFWRYSPLIFTTFVCFFCGGILSEFVQAALPYKTFDLGDIVANLFGSSIGLTISYHLEKHYRKRREIARLYRPLSADYSDDEGDDVFSAGTVLLPTHTGPAYPPKIPSKHNNKSVRFADAGDDGEELFDIGQVSDDEESAIGRGVGPSKKANDSSST
ncbi:hypothetical protein FA15DRAFT_687694 [Coprinopsis marcescibilis]|uniref:VanZ-like domain-containing protein n=1 Tax=Coprinopsis marcescibilis TaxID=230819 RepID=A0A5C3KU38_COPMA|nr:hypothetical protein FA15DRAFT_687694 [Coprinopsis marcescibilis]